MSDFVIKLASENGQLCMANSHQEQQLKVERLLKMVEDREGLLDAH